MGSVLATPSWSQTRPAARVSLATQDRVRNPGWWPTKGDAPRSAYRGWAACGECHAGKLQSQQQTPMAHAAAHAGDADVLRRHISLEFLSGTYNFQLSTTADGSVYSVSDGANAFSQPLSWAFGNGEVGQTYVYKRESRFYESRVSFYPSLQALDLTLGHHAPAPNDLEGALGRLMAASETRLCFGCHTTASTTSGHFDDSGIIPGVSCEACHGPSANHIDAMRRKQRRVGLRAILNPASLSPVDSVDFCGACHRTPWDVALAGTRGVANVRFQPYRLEKSRCWGKGDARLTCMACHDPHLPLVRDPAAYDDRCLRCHQLNSGAEKHVVAGNRSGKACPVGTTRCVACHMAKYEIPGSHAQFTDHWIRVVRENTPYPD
jgi:Cytochrome c554 and c-prime